MRIRLCVLIALLLTTLAASPEALARGKGKGGDKKTNFFKLMLSEKFGKVDPDELALDRVSFAPGATAVVLLDAEQQDYKKLVSDAHITQRISHRRVKILADEAIETYGNEVLTFDAFTTVDDVLARTILPDGTEIDASSNINRDRSTTGQEVVSISFPQVRAGAILERIVVAHIDGFYTTRRTIQDRLPVLENRFILAPPPTLQFSVASAFLTEAEAQPVPLKNTRGQSYIWQFTDVAPIVDEPNQPPLIDMAKTLYVIPVALSGQGYFQALATDWTKWNELEHREWKIWMSRGNADTRKLAQELTAGLEDPRAKAETLRSALLERVRVSSVEFERYIGSPDQVLRAGSATTAEIAGTLVTMLDAADVEADLLAYRRRNYGLVPEGFPVPILFNDAIVRIAAGGAELYLDPTAPTPVGLLPAHGHGVLAMPLDGKTTAPVHIGDLSAGDNRAVRSATLELDEAGNLSGEVVQRYMGAMAASWRSSLRDETPEQQEELVRTRLRRHMPGARLDDVTIENLSDLDKALVIRCKVDVEGYATAAGRRLLVNPNVLSRISAEDWAAESRQHDIDLGDVFDSSDVLTFQLPEGVTTVELPSGANLSAGDNGSYALTFKRVGDSVVVRRQLRLDTYRYPVAAWSGLRSWFNDMAHADDQMLVLNLP